MATAITPKTKKTEGNKGAEGAVSGKMHLADRVIELIAGVAAREVDGIHKLGKGVFKDVMARISGTSDTREGVAAEVGSREVALDLEVVVDYGVSIPHVADKLRQLVAKRVNEMTGLNVVEINLNVVDVYLEGEEPKRRVL